MRPLWRWLNTPPDRLGVAFMLLGAIIALKVVGWL